MLSKVDDELKEYRYVSLVLDNQIDDIICISVTYVG